MADQPSTRIMYLIRYWTQVDRLVEVADRSEVDDIYPDLFPRPDEIEWLVQVRPSGKQPHAPHDVDALDAIARLLSSEEWEAETIEAVADIVESTGRIIKEPEWPARTPSDR